MIIIKPILYFVVLCLILLFQNCAEPKELSTEADGDWPVYLGGKSSNQYSPLDQVNRDNVQALSLAWTYNSKKSENNNLSQIQCNPIIIDGILYATSPDLALFAVDAGTGEEIWEFDSNINDNFSQHVNRGVSFWSNKNDKRLFFSSGSNLFCVNAADGTLVSSFGDGGIVSLKAGLGEEFQSAYVVARTPGIIHNDLLIMGSTVSETMGAAPGHIRAFNVRTGELEWMFRTIPEPGEFGYETWPKNAYKTIGGANNWAGLTLDEERGIVYCPTGSAAYDFWGGNRKGKNLFANCLLALNANTGERLWHYQTIHHDIWDKDLPAPPNLITVEKNGEKVEAVAQITKHGYIFLFDRSNGNPLFPIDEISVPASDLKGEYSWPTQPVPQLPPPLVPQVFDKAMITDIDTVSSTYVSSILNGLRTGNTYIPPSTQGTIIFPGFDGGAEWGGAAAEADKGIMYVNSSIMPWIHMMVPIEELSRKNSPSGELAYLKNCAVCHGQDRKGDASGTFPNLTQVKDKYSQEEIMEILISGKGFMPSFKHIKKEELEGVISYVLGKTQSLTHIPESKQNTEDEIPYFHTGYNRFFDDKGYPAVKPPWGTLSAVDMNKGEILWQVPLGEFEELSKKGIPQTGTENYGGPVVTAGGILFIAASQDEYFRAFDKNTGQELWKYKLPAGGYATPSTYMVGETQYVVIACGGGKMGTPSGNSYLAFSLNP